LSPEDNSTITLGDSAKAKVKSIIADSGGADKKCLRVFVSGGGCSGFQYGFFIEDIETLTDNDVKIPFGEHILCTDKDSMEMLKGSVINYNETLAESGFKIENPNADASCGCGKSFTPKTEKIEKSEDNCSGCSSY